MEEEKQEHRGDKWKEMRGRDGKRWQKEKSSREESGRGKSEKKNKKKRSKKKWLKWKGRKHIKKRIERGKMQKKR